MQLNGSVPVSCRNFSLNFRPYGEHVHAISAITCDFFLKIKDFSNLPVIYGDVYYMALRCIVSKDSESIYFN